MSVVMGREKRKTAGQRMTTLVGKAQEEDDAFWGHETWNEEDSGNDSFHESDEDSALRKDEFDSDFDDSETDNEKEEEAAGEEEERELEKSERASRQRKTTYVDSKAKGTRGGGRHGGGKRIMGEGFNTGIVLNFPSSQTADSSLSLQPSHSLSQSATAAAATTAAATATLALDADTGSGLKHRSSTSVDEQIQRKSSSTKANNRKTGDPVLPRSTIVSSRERRSTHGVRKLRENRSTPAKRESTTAASRKSTTHPSSKSAKRKRFAQEELLLEAVHETEPENQRWLFGRKRVQDQSEKDANANAIRDKQRGKVVQKFHSRRGCLITLTFPEMDAVPEILTRRPQQKDPLLQTAPDTSLSSTHQQNHQPVLCVITGKKAKYRDPVTNLPYHDLAAFKELRRRHENGIPIVRSYGDDQRNQKSSNGPSTSNAVNETVDEISSARNAQVNVNGKMAQEMEGPKKAIQPQAAAQQKSVPKSSRKPKSSGGSKMGSPPVNSKLPFQSPKPGPKPVTIGSGMSTIGPAVEQHQQPGNGSAATQNEQQPGNQQLPLAQIPLSCGGLDATSNIADSPVSPSGRRLSPRKWKPSEKVLETIAMSPKKDGKVATPPGLITKPEQSLEIDATDRSNVPSIPGPPPLPDIASTASRPATTEQVKAKPSSRPKTQKQPGTAKPGEKKPRATKVTVKSAAKIPRKKAQITAKTKAGTTKNSSKSTPKSQETGLTPPSAVASKAAATAMSTFVSANLGPISGTPPKAQVGRDGTMKIPSPELEKQLHKLYMVSEENGNDAPDGRAPHPQFITQGDLIMEAINVYTKRQREEQELHQEEKEQDHHQDQQQKTQAQNERKQPPIDTHKES
jgi:vacuolar protein sorting-associated protein 72